MGYAESKTEGGQAPPLQNTAGYLLTGLSALMLAKSLSLCFCNDIWYDELFTVGMAGYSYGDLIGFTARDVHPPLYYCIVKFFVELCKLVAPAWDAAVVAKLVSALPCWLLFFYGVTLVRRRFGALAGGLFLFCAVSMPQLSAYTVEARMYSWALLFVTAALLHAGEMLAADRPSAEPETAGADSAGGSGRRHGRGKARLHEAAFVCYGLAAAYTQYFACVAVVMIYLSLLCFFLLKDRRRVRAWLRWAGLSVLGYAPWLAALSGQLTAVHENYWILPVSWRTFGGCVKFLMKPAFANETVNVVLAVLLFLVYASVVGSSVIKLYHDDRDIDAWLVCAGVCALAGLALFAIAASVLFRPVFMYRYMIPAAGCFWLAFAVSVGALAERRRTAVSGIAAACACMLALCVGLRDYRAFMGEEEYKALQMERTEAVLAELGPEDILLFNFDQLQMVLGYYVNNESYLWYGQPEPLIQEICGKKQSLEENTERIREWLSEGRSVWFAGSFNSREDIVSLWESRGIRVSEPEDCLLERYWFNLYALSLD